MGKRTIRLPSLRTFGKHVKSLRKARGMTQETFAERSSLSADTIRRLEHGSFSPSLDTIFKVCQGLDMSMSTLFVAIDLRERDVPREFADAISLLTWKEQRALFLFVAALRERDDVPE